LDALLSIFEQRYFVDDKGYLKQYPLPVESRELKHLTKTLVGIAASPEERRKMEAEEAIRRIVEGDNDEEMYKIRNELRKKDKVIAENQKVIAENQKAIAENQKAIADKDKEIAELKAKLTSRKSK
jgi:hypothetical protein